jgi:hypothetical protein
MAFSQRVYSAVVHFSLAVVPRGLSALMLKKPWQDDRKCNRNEGISYRCCLCTAFPATLYDAVTPRLADHIGKSSYKGYMHSLLHIFNDPFTARTV